MFKSINLDALLISTKRLYGVLILLGIAVLVYVSFLNFEGLSKRKLIMLKKRIKGQNTSGYTREVEEIKEEEEIEEAKATSIAAI